MLKQISKALGVAAISAASLFSVSAVAAEPIEMIMTNEIATSHWTASLMEDYAKKIEERTDGRITPKIFHSGSLYKDKEAVAALGSGAVHMVWPVSVQFESLAPQYGVVSLPFAISDQVMLKNGAPDDVADMLSKYVAEKGIRVMGLMRTADLIFLFKDKEVTTPDALSGEKVRLTGGRVLQGLMRELGASPVSMPASEMAAAMMQGAIDGIFTSAGGWQMVGTDTATTATWVPGLSLLTYTVAVDDKWLRDLPDDLKKIVVDTTNEMLETQWRQGMADDKATMDKMISDGGKLVEASPEQVKLFRAKAMEANQSFIDRHPEVWADFQKVMSKYES